MVGDRAKVMGAVLRTQKRADGLNICFRIVWQVSKNSHISIDLKVDVCLWMRDRKLKRMDDKNLDLDTKFSKIEKGRQHGVLIWFKVSPSRRYTVYKGF